MINPSAIKAWAWKFWHTAGRLLLVIVLLISSFRSAIADWNDVPTGSMKPTILEGDRIFVNKLAYDLKLPFTQWHLWTWGQPARGDVVVFLSPKDGDRLVKRVIGLPGDVLEMQGNKLFINGHAAIYKRLPDPMVNQLGGNPRQYNEFALEEIAGFEHPVMGTPSLPRVRRSFEKLTVPVDCYFMMGDNRDQSADSRFFGCVKRDRIVGQATAVALSFDRQYYYWPRWGRCFTALH